MPIRTDGNPSRRNSHCQPSRPCTPFKPLIIKPEIGFPMMPAMGRARKNDAGHKTRLRKSKQKARNVELGWRRDKHRRDRRKAPQEHNARECLSGPESSQKQVARDFEEEITHKKQGHAQSIDGIAKS